MKTTNCIRFFLTLTILLITGVTAANAQAIQVTPNVSAGANLDVTAQTKFYSKGNSDGLHIRTDNATALPSTGNDLIRVTFTQAQPNNPGMYLYSLIADGKEVDTKRMILTR